MSLAKIYRWFQLTIERTKVSRLQIAEGSERQRIAWEVLRVRWVSLGSLLVLVSLTLAIDSLTGEGISGWMARRELVSAQGVIQLFAGVVATALAAITGILISISLVVLQNAGQRYGARLTRYLISERISRYVLELLTLTLLFSLWLLVASIVLKDPPYVSAVVLLFLVTLSVLSLVIYRTHALAMLAPSESVRTLESDIIRIFHRLPARPREGNRAVMDQLQRTVSMRLADLEDLGKAVTSLNDEEGLDAIIGTYLRIIGRYASQKRQIVRESLWFPRVDKQINPENRFTYLQQRSLFDQIGRGRPMQQESDYDWFESRCFRDVRALLVEAATRKLSKPIVRAISHLSVVIPHLVDVQEKVALDKALELQRWLVGLSGLHLEDTGELLNALGAVGHHVIGTHRSKEWIERVCEPSFRQLEERKIWAMNAPRAFERVMLQIHEQLDLETMLEAETVTPESWLREEVSEAMSHAEREFKNETFRAVAEDLVAIIGREASNNGEYVVAATYLLTLLWHRCLLTQDNELLELLPDDRLQLVKETIFIAPATSEWIEPLLNEVTSCAFLSLVEERYRDAADLARPLIVSMLTGHESPTEALDVLHRIVGVCSFALLISEIRNQPQIIDDLFDPILELLADDHDRWRWFKGAWELAVNPGLVFTFGLLESVRAKYNDYFLRAWRELREVVQIPDDRGAPWDTALDHPSDFIRRHAQHGTVDVNDCADEFLRRLMQHAPRGFDDTERDSP